MSVDGEAWRPETVLVLVAAALALPYNLVLWGKIVAAAPPSGVYAVVFLAATFCLLTALFALALLLLPLRWLGRPLLSLLLPLAALAAYFMHAYGVAIDDRMIMNVFETDRAEALQLMSVVLLVYFLLLGVLPVVWLWKVPLRRQRWAPALRARLLALGAALAVIALVAGGFYQSYASLLRNHRDLRFYIVPNNLVNGFRHYVIEDAGVEGPLQVVGGDAHQRPRAAGRKPVVVVLVIGETARADHLSLNGYPRPTTPKLAQVKGLVNFSAAHSCGTETAVSLPCMVSNLGQDDYSPAKAAARENLMDVVRRAGPDVVWVENQSGCKRACDRVQRVYTRDLKLPQYCQDGECHDEILIEALRRQLASVQRDTLMVLHQMGSHGPAYYLRYPVPAFEAFTPVCKTNVLDQCTPEQIINTYDNTIHYTDHVLAGLIDTLRADAAVDSAFVYLSDHGESLGEYGLYLHGAPRMLAPSQQTHIPMVAWFSDGYLAASGLRSSCVARRSGDPVSHDNLFHSVLGLLAVATRDYRRDLDLFSPCMKPRR